VIKKYPYKTVSLCFSSGKENQGAIILHRVIPHKDVMEKFMTDLLYGTSG
jgi:hypothetical protein